MIEENFKIIVETVVELIRADGDKELSKIISDSTVSIEDDGYSEYDYQLHLFSVYIVTDIDAYKILSNNIEEKERHILSIFTIASKAYRDEKIINVNIIPRAKNKIDWTKINNLTTKDGLIEDIDRLKGLMISVSTGGDKIQDVNTTYKNIFYRVNNSLSLLDLKNPNPYLDLWNWYEKYKKSFSTYQERRMYISNLYESLVQELQEIKKPDYVNIIVNLEGWDKVKRNVTEIESRILSIENEEQCQSIGLLCREAIITLAQAVFDSEKHVTLEDINVSKTDSKRMLDAYAANEVGGSSNEKLRKYIKSTIDLANELTHKRTATKKDALLCKSATITLINIIGIIEEKI